MGSRTRFKGVRSSLRASLAVWGLPRPPAWPAGALLSTVILATAAWAQAAPPGEQKLEQTFPHASAMRGCTQEDAPALEIYLTRSPFAGTGDPSPPYIHIEISSSPQETIAPITLNLIQMRRDPAKPGRIARAELVEAERSRAWLSGTITLTEAAPGRKVSGRYAVTTPAGRRLESSFSADYSTRSAVCG
jgi:hypothetical protein